MAEAALARGPAATAPLGAGSIAFPLAAGDGTRLRAAILPGESRGVALLLHGRTEFLEKYAETAPEFARRGFAVASLDWRGQGGSARLLANARIGHVGDFAAYQRDLAALLAAPEVARLPGPRVAVAHSMGGCVALRALSSGALAAAAPAAAVFSAPMWGLAGAAGRLGGPLARLACALGLDARFAIGGGPEPYALSPFEGNLLTGDPAQHARLARLARAHPRYGIGGPSWGWLRAATREMRALRGARLEVPALVAIGTEEAVVSPAAARRRAERDGLRLVEIEGGRHELFFETPARRARLWREIDEFLAARGL